MKDELALQLPPELREISTQAAQMLLKEKAALAATDVPIVTVSASFTEDLKQWYGLPYTEIKEDVVFSRAHYSMAVAILMAAWNPDHRVNTNEPSYLQAFDQALGKNAKASASNRRKPTLEIHPKRAWLVDPTNYVPHHSQGTLTFTELVGTTLAHHSWLKKMKDLIDRFGRSKLPILNTIKPPLEFLTADLKKPILSLHIASGNTLIDQGKTLLQVVTDPHVREEYVNNAENPRIRYCVFDERTKLELLSKAADRGFQVPSNRVVVTGPPIDPRVSAARKHKSLWQPTRPLRLCIATGGLGTNRDEIATILDKLIPTLKQRPNPYQLVVYAGTRKEIKELVYKTAKKHQVALGSITDTSANLRVLYHPQIVDANDLLINYGFPWADGFITKPSGDMAYDAAAAGCFLLTLQEWGVWEHNIRLVFEGLGIAKRAETTHIVEQLRSLLQRYSLAPAWIPTAQAAARELPALFTQGSYHILDAYQDFAASFKH